MKYLLPLLLVLPLASCDATNYATPEERERILQLDKDVADAESSAKVAMARVKAAEARLRAAAVTGEQIVFDAAVEEMYASLRSVDAAEKALNARLVEMERVHGAVRGRATDVFVGIAQGFVPPPFQGPAGALIAALAGRLAFRRSRKHLATAGKSLLRGQIPQLVAGLAKAFGLSHTSPQSAQLAESQSLAEEQARVALQNYSPPS